MVPTRFRSEIGESVNGSLVDDGRPQDGGHRFDGRRSIVDRERDDVVTTALDVDPKAVGPSVSDGQGGRSGAGAGAEPPTTLHRPPEDEALTFRSFIRSSAMAAVQTLRSAVQIAKFRSADSQSANPELRTRPGWKNKRILPLKQ